MIRHWCFLLLVVLVTLGILCSGCILMIDEKKTIPEINQTKAAENLTATVTAMITSLGDTLTGTAERVANDPDNRSLIKEEFTGLYLKYPSIEALLIVDSENRISSVLPNDNTLLKSYAETIIEDPDFTSFAESQKLDIVHFRHNNRSLSVAILPMIAGDGTYEGVILVLLDASMYYGTVIDTFRQETGYNAWIIDGNGYILHYPDSTIMDATVLQLNSPDQMQLDRLIADILQNKSGTGTFAVYNYGKYKITTHAATWETVTPYKGNGYSPNIVVTSELTSSQKIDYPVQSADMELEEFVQSARRFARELGSDAALAEFNKPDGNFTTKEYYITAFDRNNILLANPYRQELIGTDRTYYADANGVNTVRMFALRANQGGGYVTHVWENPADDMQEEIKISYVLPVNRNWYILAGEFRSELTPKITLDMRKEMIQYAREIKTFVQEAGKEEAAASLNNGSRYRPDIELNILDTGGNVRVHDSDTYIPENIMGMTDIYGASIGRGLLSLANDGGGFMYINSPSLKSPVTELSLIYAEPIDDEWAVFVSVPFHTIA